MKPRIIIPISIFEVVLALGIVGLLWQEKPDKFLMCVFIGMLLLVNMGLRFAKEKAEDTTEMWYKNFKQEQDCKTQMWHRNNELQTQLDKKEESK